MTKIAYALMTLALVLAFSLPAFAQEADPMTQDELISLVGEAVVEEAANSSDELRKAKDILDAVRNRKGATEQEQTAAEMDYQQARDRYNKASNNLDNARVDALALECGKTSDEIRAMRNSGMGWGRIAKECGVHPSANGKGQGKNKDKGMGKDKSKDKGNKKPKK
ncbi:hypothetical protein [Pseudodesulfovibrio indicus]|uniref:Uncharacterized protein n=1 Tax=Pseudodesulfovibrio indicus TaxID=1716143 RepID=A0A126QNH5_9BACT|nr:hypothetical protein [Pseudodesulfovibrio indicus]AMK11228.1 hypothetical protein AWY79_08925 [Pseudodesulfovibrio indicus]TDT92255.1 hypothetical protein EDC59_101661 [Pseudodesulfovibrio indicus]